MNLIHRSQLLEALDWDLHFGSGYKVFQILRDQGITISLRAYPEDCGNYAVCTLSAEDRDDVTRRGDTAMVAIEAAIREWVAP